MVGHQGIHVFLGNALDCFSENLAELLDHGPDQQRYVVPALPQGGYGNGKDVQTIVEILAEPPFPDTLSQVAVGGGNDADVDRYRRRAPEPFELPFLEHPEQLRLQLDRHFTDLVEKNGRTVGGFKTAYLRGQRPGVGPLLPPEKLGLDQRRREGGAIELYHGAVFSTT